MTWMRIGLVNVLVVLIGWILMWLGQEGIFESLDSPIVAGLVVSVVGVFTFFMTLDASKLARMRNAIAASFVAAYLPLLAFIVWGPSAAGPVGDSEHSAEFLKTFSAMVTAIVAFYFTAQTIQRVNERIQARREREGRVDPGEDPFQEEV